MQRVYNTTGLSILGALGTSYVALSLPLTAGAFSTLSVVGLITSFVGLIGSSYMKPEYHLISEKLNSKEKIETLVARSSILRSALYGLGVMGLGLGAAPLFAIASAVSPSILPTALGLTAALFGGASLMAYKMPKDSMLGYGRVLTGSLFGLIGLQLVGLGSAFFMGPNPFSMMLLNSSSYIAVGLFTAMIAYDTHFSIKMYELGQPDHLGASVQFLLDFWNIFISLVRIFINNSDWAREWSWSNEYHPNCIVVYRWLVMTAFIAIYSQQKHPISWTKKRQLASIKFIIKLERMHKTKTTLSQHKNKPRTPTSTTPKKSPLKSRDKPNPCSPRANRIHTLEVKPSPQIHKKNKNSTDLDSLKSPLASNHNKEKDY